MKKYQVFDQIFDENWCFKVIHEDTLKIFGFNRINYKDCPEKKLFVDLVISSKIDQNHQE